MRAESTTDQNRTSGIIPPIVARNADDVKSVEVIGPWRIRVTFFDGVAGIVDMVGMVHSPRAGVFAALKDPAVFDQVGIVYGTVTWENGLDLAPDAMYHEIKANGEWILR
jgi:hypothetical protein